MNNISKSRFITSVILIVGIAVLTAFISINTAYTLDNGSQSNLINDLFEEMQTFL